MEVSSIIKKIAPISEIYAIPENEQNKVSEELDNKSINKRVMPLINTKTPLLAELLISSQKLIRDTRYYLDIAKENNIQIINDSTGFSIVDSKDFFDVYLEDYIKLKNNVLDTETLKSRYETKENLTSLVKNILLELNMSHLLADLDKGDNPSVLGSNLLSKLDDYVNTNQTLLNNEKVIVDLINTAKKENNIVWIQAAGNDGDLYPTSKPEQQKNQLGFGQRFPSDKIIVGSTGDRTNKPTPWSSDGPAVDFREHQGLKALMISGTSLSAPAVTGVFVLAQRYAKQLNLPHDADSILKVMQETAVDGDIRPLAIQRQLEQQAQKVAKPSKAR
jgi:hypothetical protein